MWHSAKQIRIRASDSDRTSFDHMALHATERFQSSRCATYRIATHDLGDKLRSDDQLNVVASDDNFANDAHECPNKKQMKKMLLGIL